MEGRSDPVCQQQRFFTNGVVFMTDEFFDGPRSQESGFSVLCIEDTD
ncbi:MAG: hypothetical protein AAF500_12255 [Myxococcota bacterium]